MLIWKQILAFHFFLRLAISLFFTTCSICNIRSDVLDLQRHLPFESQHETFRVQLMFCLFQVLSF